jgi:hypothetical protein
LWLSSFNYFILHKRFESNNRLIFLSKNLQRLKFWTPFFLI